MKWYKKANSYIGYHGSPHEFQEFSYKFMGQNGTSEGFGFYFTSDEHVAEGYAEGGNVKKAYLTINKPLSHDELTISPKDLAKFLMALDPDGQGYLSNWGDATYDGYKNVVKTAVEGEISTSQSDVDLISGIIQGSGRSPELIYPTLKKILGYDGIIVNKSGSDWGHTIYVVFDNSQIKHVK